MGNPLRPQPGPDGATCAGCAWRHLAGPGRRVPRCVEHGDARIADDWAACDRYAAALDCLDCGACCREAFTTVEVGPRDPIVRARPDLLVRQDSGRLALRRLGGPEPATGPRCACLVGDGPYACVAYDARPKTCRGFTRGSPACADARRRVGR